MKTKNYIRTKLEKSVYKSTVYIFACKNTRVNVCKCTNRNRWQIYQLTKNRLHCT